MRAGLLFPALRRIAIAGLVSLLMCLPSPASTFQLLPTLPRCPTRGLLGRDHLSPSKDACMHLGSFRIASARGRAINRRGMFAGEEIRGRILSVAARAGRGGDEGGEEVKEEEEEEMAVGDVDGKAPATKEEGGDPASSVKSKARTSLKGPLMAVSLLKASLKMTGILLYLSCTFSLAFVFNAVPPSCIGVCVMLHAYLWILARTRYSPVAKESKRLKAYDTGGMLGLGGTQPKWILPYSAMMAVVSVIVPWFLILSSTDKYMALLSPHLFVLMYQIFLEAVSGGWPAPLRVAVPITLNAYRMPMLLEWSDFIFDPSLQFTMRSSVQFGAADKALCVASIILWGVNLFLFLVPKCFDAVLHPKYRPGLTSGELDEEARVLGVLSEARGEKQ